MGDVGHRTTCEPLTQNRSLCPVSPRNSIYESHTGHLRTLTLTRVCKYLKRCFSVRLFTAPQIIDVVSLVI
jgi:hypothetical protein